jgi:quinohemoprotein ethanol dehydrogenase
MLKFMRPAAAGLFALSLFTLPAVAGTAPSAVDGKLIANPPKGEWLSYGRAYDETRFSPLDQLNPETVKGLALAWSIETGTNRGVESTPLFADGILYATLPWSDVIAVDARTGKELWRFDAKVPREWGQKGCCDVVNRGVAMWQGRLYVGTFDGRLVALDAKTGKKIFDVNTIDKTKPYTITGAPRVVKGKVLIGNGGAELGVRGYMSAYDAKTGKLAWRFYTVPGDPKKPFENPELEMAAKTWTGDTYWKIGGGGTPWDSMAYDPSLDTLYVGTGNGSPWSKYVRSPGGGDNLFLSSILALDPDTGRLKWHYQTTPGDTWDYTATQSLILADLKIGDAVRQVIMQAPKNGFFYVLDRKTGELLSADAYAKMTWANGVDLKTGRPNQTEEGQWKDKGALVYPSPLGGHNWQPMSFNPKTGLVYIPAMEVPAVYSPEKGFKYRPGVWNTGADFSEATDAPPEFFGGSLLAWDPVAHKPAWTVQLAGHWNGGTLTTAGNLVFQGTSLGSLVAYRADNGEKLWEGSAGSGIIAAPMTYELDGQQYVTIMAGWGGASPLAHGRGALAHGGSGIGRMLTFKVGGTAKLAVLKPSADIPPPPKATAPIEQVKLGEQLFGINCGVCHGLGAVSGGVLPDLRHAAPEVHARWDEIVRGGELAEHGMIGFAKFLSKDQTDALHAYVIYRANEGDVPKPIEVKPAAAK